MVVEKDMREIKGFAREVVAKRVAIIAAITILINLALAYGWVTPEINHDILKWVNEALDAVAALVAIGVVRPAVTPKKSPQTDSGEPLVPASVVAKAVDAAKAENAPIPATPVAPSNLPVSDK